MTDFADKKEIPANYDANNPNQMDCLDEDGGLLIWAEATCRVSILSSNVNQEHVRDSSNAENRGSVVVLIKSFDKKILICGDATFNTEKELITRYGDKIANIDVLRVGHHGSSVTSSQKEFISHVKAKMAWISESRKSAYHSPSFEVIKRLWEHADAGAAPHDLYFWNGNAYSGFQHYQLSECAGKSLVGSDGTLTFTPDLITSYFRKHVYLTAAPPNELIEFTSAPSLLSRLYGLIEFILTSSGLRFLIR
jgi:hypothetical protein